MTWYLDGVDLSTLAWNVKNRSAGWTVPGKIGENVRVPGRNGTFWTPNKTFDEGHLTLSMWAAGTLPDGTLPLTMSGKKVVLENLDKLTALFATSRRLLNLRYDTGDGTAIVNDATNPLVDSPTSAGKSLATNRVTDSYRTQSTLVEVSRNLTKNPFMRGRTKTTKVYTEDLYPDPLMNARADNPTTSLFRSYYYPISQDPVTTNQFFTPINGFTMKTGQSGLRGLISINKAITFPSDAWVGTIGREVWTERADAVDFYLQIKLNDNAKTSTAQIRIQPGLSYGGTTWVNGSSTANITINKDTYTWIIVPASQLPTTAGGNNFHVRYQIRIVGGSSWNAGAAFDVNTVAIQDAPKAGNPWRDSLDPSLIIMGNRTKLITNRGGPKSDMGWSEFAKPTANEWTPLQTSSQTTTSPYAFAWAQRDAKYNNEGNTCFSVFGGVHNTFRRILPAARYNMTNVRMWGKYWRNVPGTITLKLVERQGSAGAYTWTKVISTVVLTNGLNTFTTGAFAIEKGKVYAVEASVPRSTDGGLTPSLILRELHVSNGVVNTSIPKGKTTLTGNGFSSKYSGSMYASTIEGTSYTAYGATVGCPLPVAHAYASTNVKWADEPQGAFSVDGLVELDKYSIPNPTRVQSVTSRIRVGTYLPTHLRSIHVKAESMDLIVRTRVFNTAGTVVRTVTNNITATSTVQTFSQTITLGAAEVAVQTTVDGTGGVYGGIMPCFVVTQHHLMTDLPAGISLYTGSSTSATATWARSVSWAGTPYFSESSFKVSLPKGWTTEKFMGFDADKYSIRIGGGGSIRVPITQNGDTAAKVGIRTGSETFGAATVTVTPQGGTAVSMGTLNGGGDFSIRDFTLPANATYIDISVASPTSLTIRDVFVYQWWSPVLPFSQGGWMGFKPGEFPDLKLPAESPKKPAYAVARWADGSSTLTTGSVDGWDGDVLEGGYIPMPAPGTTKQVSTTVKTSAPFVSVAVRTRVPATPATIKARYNVQTSTDGVAWATRASTTVQTTAYREQSILDTAVPSGSKFVRVVIVVENTTTRTDGVAAVIEGITISPSKAPLGSNFPGFFVGIKGPDGSAQYTGNIRQAMVEVTEAIDMESSAYGEIAEFNVNMVVPGSFWEDVYDTVSEQSASAAAKSGTFYFEDFLGATAPTQDARFEITAADGSTLTELELTDVATGNTMRYKGAAQSKITIIAAQTRVVNANNVSVIKNVTGVGSSCIMTLTPYFRTVGDSFPSSREGQPAIAWSANKAIKIKVTGRRKYLIG